MEGQFVERADAGVPVCVCLQMQQLGLSLEQADWSTRQTCGGFSVTFFWPSSLVRTVKSNGRTKRKRGSRKRKVSTPCHMAAPAGVPTPVVCEQAHEGVPAALINDQPSSESRDGVELQPASNSSPKPDWMACSGITFEEKDSIPGVRYTTPSGEAAWTPVLRCHRPRRKSLQPLECESDAKLFC